jgi:signal transduction histidine kinase
MNLERQDRLTVLKKQLEAELLAEETDYGQILGIASELASLDPQNLRFTVDGALISRLGRELVARQETAVSELAKNAYDADASNVTMCFVEAFEPGGTLLIEDDGTGMTYEQLTDGFMRLSSQEKVRQPISTRYGRRRAGRKGIGRFAAQRLGSKLTLTTQTEDNPRAYRLVIDWSKFDGAVDLVGVPFPILQVEKTRSFGTELRIEQLSEGWRQQEIGRVYRTLMELIQPFPLTQTKAPVESGGDPGFTVQVFTEQNGVRKEVASVAKMVFNLALAEIDAAVDENGRGTWSITSTRLAFGDLDMPVGPDRDGEEAYEVLRGVKLKAYYYVWVPELFPRNQMRSIQEYAKDHGGIRLYRNGFRVQPYGEPLNDWLELDRSYNQRVALNPHGNFNFFGFVEVHDPEATTFEETASREGLIQNDAYRELVDFAFKVLKGAATRVGQLRGRKTSAGQKNWIRESERAASRLGDIARELESTAESLPLQSAPADEETSSQLSNVRATLLDTARLVDEVRTIQEQRHLELVREENMLWVLSSMGLAVAEFAHEIKHLLPAIQADARETIKLLPVSSEGKAIAGRLEMNSEALRLFTSYFDRTVSDNTRREVHPQELGMVLGQFRQALHPVAKRYGIVFAEPLIEGYDLFTCPMHRSEWTSILLNFFTNSRKAIQRARRAGRIGVRAGRAESTVYVEFFDNGDGIPQEVRDRIFEPFFTTTSPQSPVAELRQIADEASGTGLGLKIVRDIVESHVGEVELVSPPEGYITCFRVTLPRATPEQIEGADD